MKEYNKDKYYLDAIKCLDRSNKKLNKKKLKEEQRKI